MKFPILTICIIALFGSSSGLAGSVWEEIKLSSNSVQGKIKGIVFTDKEVMVRVAVDASKTSGEQIEMIPLCVSFVGGDSRNLKEADQLNQVRDAVAKGQTVIIGYDSVFNRCISTIQDVDKST